MLGDNIIHDNRASWGGGLYFHNGPTATLTTNIINNNVADHKGWGVKDYAGVWFDHSDNATLISNTINSNRTANDCGGVCFETSHNAVLIGNDVISNTRGPGWDGNGVGVYLSNSKNASLVGNTISHNTASDMDRPGTIWGGGVYIGVNSTAALVSNKISSNGATRGGGLYVKSNSIVTLMYDIITGNTVYDSFATWPHVRAGGGLCVDNSIVTLTNVVVADNQAETVGSGLYITRSSARLLHTTIARNTGGDGSGVYITGTSSTVALTNTILVSHTVGITCAASNTVTLNSVLWYSNTVNTGGTGAITITNEYTGDPAFAADGYHLTASSEAIDKGVNAGVDDDIDSEPRPAGVGYDIGADEYYHPALDVTKQADPNPVQAGALLTYIIRVTNTGNADLHATVTDTLPAQVTPIGALSWTPTIAAPGGVWMETVVVTVEMGYAGPLTNVVQVTTVEGATGATTVTVSAICYKVYLPLVLR
jgi:uncharacterized repeat protein (TIGR01451 family)